MSHAARILQVAIWTVVIFLLTPSKVAAIAYSLLVGGLLIVVIVALGVGRGIISAISTIAKLFR